MMRTSYKTLVIFFLISIFGFSKVLIGQDPVSDSFFKDDDQISSSQKADPNYHIELGDEYYSKNDQPLALSHYKKALAQKSSLHDDILIGKVHLNIGNIYFDISDHDNAFKNYFEALQLFEKSDSITLINNTKTEIGNLYIRIDQCDNGFKYLFQSLNAYSKSAEIFEPELTKTYQFLGIAYGSCGNLDSALYYFDKTTQFVAEQDSNVFLAGLLNNMGAIYSKKNDSEKALEYYQRSLEIFDKIGSNDGIAVSTSNIAYIHMQENNLNTAIVLYEDAIELFKENGSLYYLGRSYFNMSGIYEQQKKYKQALKYNNLYQKINDSLANSDELGRVADLQMKFEIRKKDQEIKIVEQEKELIEQEKKLVENEKILVEKDNKISQTRQYLLIGGIVLILLIGILVVRNFKISLNNNRLKQQVLQQEKKQLSENLQYKNKELENFALRIIEKNELLLGLKEKIKTLDTQKPEEIDKIKDLSISINNNLYIDEDRREFELRIDKTHQSFFAHLDQQFPTLTKNERRLCSLLVLDLSSKDIATILNISPDGVKKSRYRLRKKLNIEAEINLSDFLKKI